MDSALSAPAGTPDIVTEPGASDAARASTPAPSPGDAPAIVAPERSAADQWARRILRLPVDAPRESIFGTESVFGRSIAVSAVRCLITYVFLPLLGPVLKLSGTVGPIVGLVLGVVSVVAITVSMRRFFAADHKYRWHYAAVGVALYVALLFAAVADISALAG